MVASTIGYSILGFSGLADYIVLLSPDDALEVDITEPNMFFPIFPILATLWDLAIESWCVVTTYVLS